MTIEAVFEVDARTAVESCKAIEIQFFCYRSAGLLMTMFIGHMLVDTVAGHTTCGGAYFQAFESG